MLEREGQGPLRASGLYHNLTLPSTASNHKCFLQLVSDSGSVPVRWGCSERYVLHRIVGRNNVDVYICDALRTVSASFHFDVQDCVRKKMHVFCILYLPYLLLAVFDSMIEGTCRIYICIFMWTQIIASNLI